MYVFHYVKSGHKNLGTNSEVAEEPWCSPAVKHSRNKADIRQLHVPEINLSVNKLNTLEKKD